MYYQYICDIGEEKSLRDGCSSICSRVAICCVGLATRNFGNGCAVLSTGETIIASSGLQLSWEGYVFFGFLHSGQVVSSFKCYFKRKYLNLIDSICDVDESCPWLFNAHDHDPKRR